MAKNHCFRERHKQVSRDAGQQEHGSKHNADRKRGHECGRCDLRRAVQTTSSMSLSGSASRLRLIFSTSTVASVHEDADC